MVSNSRIVWKFALDIGTTTEVPATHGAQALHVAFDDEILVVWLLCDPDAPRVVRRMRTVLTGEPFAPAESDRYVGTAVAPEIWFVAHVFDLGEGVRDGDR